MGDVTPRPQKSVLDFMELHLRSLYTHDATGRISARREPGGHRPARFHLARTRLGNLWRFRDDLPAEDVTLLARLAGKEAPLSPLAVEDPAKRPDPPERLEPIRRVLRARGPIEFEWAGPAYCFPDDLTSIEERASADAAGASRVVAVGSRDEGLLERHFAAWIPELRQRQPCFAVVEDGSALAICESARPMGGVSATFQECVATEAGVETAAPYRGRGFAARAVAAWAAEVVRMGGCPLYSTGWENRASRAVARKLRLICFGDDIHLR
jgi:hypothetical protein